ncbi:MAG: DNA-directed RNA polymerase subunit RpoH/Rpb5 C-terminal domain-containing protein [Candidatus Micrarchaeia archaeon]
MTEPFELIPKHRLLDEKEIEKVLKKFNVTLEKFPKIYENDPQAKKLNAKAGQMIEIKREDPTGEYLYYRVVIKG